MGHHEFPKYQSKHQDQDIPQTHEDGGDMELCGHKTTQVLVEEDGVGQCNLMEGVVDQACSHDLDKMQVTDLLNVQQQGRHRYLGIQQVVFGGRSMGDWEEGMKNPEDGYNFRPVGSNIWFKLYGPPSDPDVDLIGTVIQSWYLMGRLGAYNSSNLQWPFILQLANTSMEYNPLYDADKGFNVMPSSFHDVGDVEFQDNWGRVWVDIVFGGQSMGDWEEGMKNPEDGYKSFKI
ncbi:sodium- and chloride-dependent GABA transporter [Tanacetum coccineum]